MNFLKHKAKSFLIFLIILALILLIYTSLLYKEIIPNNTSTINITSYIIGIVLFFILGGISGIFETSKGWLGGITSGIIPVIVICIFKLISQSLNSWLLVVKYLSYIISSMVGGMIGINFNKDNHIKKH